MKIPLIYRVRMKIFGTKYSLTQVVSRILISQFGIHQYYSLDQINRALKIAKLGSGNVEAKALALYADVGKMEKYQDLYKIRDSFGLNGEGAMEVFKEYCKIEKYNSDPFGSDQAKRTHGINSANSSLQ